MELDAVVGPLLSFPCIFQVVPDKIVAFEQVMLQDFDAIILPLRCPETFASSTFVEIVESMGGAVPRMVYMIDFGEVTDHRKSDFFLRLTPDGSIPLHELIRVVNNAVLPSRVVEIEEVVVPTVYAVDAEEIERPVGLQQPIHAALPCEPVSPSKRSSCKRKRDRACASRNHENASSRVRQGPEQDPHMLAYMQYWQAVHAHQQWQAQQHAHEQRVSKSSRRRTTAAGHTKPPQATDPSLEADGDSSSHATTVESVMMVTGSSDAEAEADFDADADAGVDFACFEGFEDMYGLLMDDAGQLH
jgi:hypothetical protein